MKDRTPSISHQSGGRLEDLIERRSNVIVHERLKSSIILEVAHPVSPCVSVAGQLHVPRDMDPISLTASVIAILQLTTELIKATRSYYKDFHNAPKEIAELIEESKSFESVLENLKGIIQEADAGERSETARSSQHGVPKERSRLPMVQELMKADGALVTCYGEMLAFRQKLQSTQSNIKRSLKWPFKKDETKAVIGRLRNLKSDLHTAILSDQTALNLKIQDGIGEVGKSISAAAVERLVLDISCWLRPPDPSSNLASARKKRQQDTGLWLLNDPKFRSWKTSKCSLLWLFGKAGSGKTVLSSTAVHQLLDEREKSTAIVYFYFDFQSREKQSVEGLLNSIIVQVLRQDYHNIAIAERLYNSHFRGATKPSLDELKSTTRSMFDICPKLLFFIDALDECDDRGDLLSFVEEMRAWNQAHVHLFLTSRQETSIEDSLIMVATHKISLEDSVVDGDILAYVRHELQHDPQLSRWSTDVLLEIERALLNGAQGMFRWVECQLDAIRGCLKLSLLRKTLKSLPKTLDDTYERILCKIPEAYLEDARRILACLLYSFHPLAVQEIADTVAIASDGEIYYNDEERLCQPRDILTICSGLVTVTDSLRNTEVGFAQMHFQELRLAHYSVKEYLVSERMRSGKSTNFALEERSTHEALANLCIRYLFHCHEEGICQDSESLMRYDMVYWERAAFAPYAASFWSQHLKAARLDDRTALLRLSLDMVTKPAILRDLMRLRRPWWDMEEVIIMQQYGCIKTREKMFDGILDMTVDAVPPLFYVSLLGLDSLVSLLLNKGENINNIDPRGTCLAAAAAGGHYSTVQLLVEKGANIDETVIQRNLEGDDLYSRTAIHEAAYHRRRDVVGFLLSRKADVNIGRLCAGSSASNISYDTALEAILAFSRDAPLMRMLVDASANLNACGAKEGTALCQIIDWTLDVEVLKIFLDAGADPNLPYRPQSFKTPLYLALQQNNALAARLLIERGANPGNIDVCIFSGIFDHGEDVGKRLELLIDCLVNETKRRDHRIKLPLFAVRKYGWVDITALFLQQGLSEMIMGGGETMSMHDAAFAPTCLPEIIDIVLADDGSCHIDGGFFGSALHAAAFLGMLPIAQKLLDCEVPVNDKANIGYSPLRLAMDRLDHRRLASSETWSPSVRGADSRREDLCTGQDIFAMPRSSNRSPRDMTYKDKINLPHLPSADYKVTIDLLKSHGAVAG